MSECGEMRENIKDIDTYVSSFPFAQRSAAVELLFSKAMSSIFHLQFRTSVTDDPAVPYRVVWGGQDEKYPRNAPKDSCDTIVFARHFDVLVEITQSTGVKQWDREFARALRHMGRYVETKKKQHDTVYLMLVVKEIHVDTYNSIRQKIREGSNIVLLTFTDLEQILEVCDLTIGLRHFDLKHLFGMLARNAMDIADLPAFDAKCARTISDWRGNFLRRNKLVYLGIKGYNTFKTIGLTHLTASFIVTELDTQKDVKTYFKILGERPTREGLLEGMITLGLAFETGLPQLDPILTIVSKLEIEARINEILANIKEDQ